MPTPNELQPFAEDPVLSSRALETFVGACGAARPVELEIVGPNGAPSRRRTLDRPFALIGRARRNEIHLKATVISPRHAYLQTVAGQPFILDLESKAGTRCNGVTRGGSWLRPG